MRSGKVVAYIFGKRIRNTRHILQVPADQPDSHWSPIEEAYPEIGLLGKSADFRQKGIIYIMPPQLVDADTLQAFADMPSSKERHVYPIEQEGKLVAAVQSFVALVPVRRNEAKKRLEVHTYRLDPRPASRHGWVGV